MADSGNYYLQNFGPNAPEAPAAAPQAAPAQGAAASAQVAPPPQKTGNYYSDTYGPNDIDQPPPPSQPKPSKAHVASQALASTIDQMASGGGKILGGLAVLGDKIHSAFSAPDQTGMQDWWFSHAVDPYVQAESENQLGPDATTGDRAVYGVTHMAATIASYFLGGEVMGPAEGLSSRLAARLAQAGANSTVPAASAAIDVGQSVLDATGDKKAAAKAASMTYVTTAVGALGPAAVGGSLLAKIASGAAIGGVGAEAQRRAQNAAMPENMQEPFDPLNAVISTVGGGVMGAAVHATMPSGVVEGAPANAMERAQQHAAQAAAAEGGDRLDQVAAATQVGAEVGAHHDAAAVQGARDAEAQAHVDALQAHQEQEARDAAFAANEAAKGATPAQEALQKEQGFQQAAGDKEAAKEADFAKAKNQVGEQAVEAAKTEDIGAEKGGANEPKPTLAEALPPEQLAALQSLKERRAAAGAETQPTVQEAMRAQAKGTPEDFQELPKEAPPPKAAPEEITAPEEAPETNPPPQTPQTLAERRQADLDAKMAAKVRGTPSAELPEVSTAASTEAAGSQPGAPPNRLATIRAAAEKRQGAAEFTPSTDEQLAGYAEKAAAKRKGETPNLKAPENDWFNDLRSRLAMPHDEAKEHLSGVSDAQGERAFQVHESATADTIPPKLAAQIQDHLERGGKPPKGAYDDGVAHVFAASHETGDKEDLLSTAVHELAHKGLESFLGPELGHTMDGIYGDIKNTAWAKRLVERRGMDTSRVDTQRLVANEYAAHMAENIAANRDVHAGLPVKDAVAGHWQRVVDTVRAGLRKIGLVKHWNDNDIAALIRQAQAHSGGDRVGREGQAYKQSGGAQFSLPNDDEYMEQHFAPDHPLAQAHKFGRTMEEQAKYNPGSIRRLADTLSDLRDSMPRRILGGVGLRNLPDFMSANKMPSLHKAIDVHDAMDGRRGQLINRDSGLTKEWSQWQAGQDDRGQALSDLMHQATLSGHDPSKTYAERSTPEERAASPEIAQNERLQRNIHRELKADYDKLDDKGKELFNRVRDNYTQKRVAVFDALNQRIQESGADAQTKKEFMASLRKQFESGTVKGPYFPLQRFGDMWAAAKDEEGNTKAFARFESGSQRKAWQAEMRKQGLDVSNQGQRMDANSTMERIDPDFVKNIMAKAHEIDPSGSLEKDIWGEYLKAMPEMSMRKHMIARVGRLGFSGDALRAFAFNSFHGAHQLARLEYGNRFAETVDGAGKEADALSNHAAANPDDKVAQSDGRWAPALAQELKDRQEWINNPRAAAWASNLTKFGFTWYLGAAPATAFRIFSQNPMIAAPILAKKFGWMGASKELGRATAQWAKAHGSLGDTLRGDERKMFDEADAMGVFSNTNTQNLASGGSGAPLFRGPYYQFQKYAGFMFQAMEHHNRMTTALAGYRLARQQGMEHADASKYARQASWDAHFDYGNANRPRYLQGNAMKVIGLFKQYSLGVSYRLAREGADMINKEKDPQERLAAAQALGGLIGRMGMFAGVTGVPFYWAIEATVNALLGDKDQPFDMTAAIHKQLNDSMGQTAGDAIMTGPVGAITGASLSGGASYNDLWYRPPSREETASEQVMDAMGQFLGPLAAIPANAASGMDMMAKGNQERGLEHFLPPEAAALAKAVRYATQGANNMSGEPVVPQEDITSKDLFLQSMGFTPQKIADAYARNSAIKNIDKQITDRRQLLSNQLEVAYLNGDDKAVDSLLPQVEHFNEENPGLAIGKGIASGILGKAKRGAAAVNGVNVAKGNEHLEQEY